jgi:preprotein translocase subunit SecB
MSDQAETDHAAPAAPGDGSDPAAAQQARPPLIIQAQYVKDLSFEAPGAPDIFGKLAQSKPDINVKVDVKATAIGENIFETVLNIRADCTVSDATAFIAELSYGGVFAVNVPAESVRPVLLIECPRILFPFARQIISQTTLDGGFMPLMLAPIDFAALYRNQQSDSASAAAKPIADGAGDGPPN